MFRQHRREQRLNGEDQHETRPQIDSEIPRRQRRGADEVDADDERQVQRANRVAPDPLLGAEVRVPEIEQQRVEGPLRGVKDADGDDREDKNVAQHRFLLQITPPDACGNRLRTNRNNAEPCDRW